VPGFGKCKLFYYNQSGQVLVAIPPGFGIIHLFEQAGGGHRGWALV
jgi:hypothetical protein